jgi:ketopantoate hydroxymethyltransferase
MRLTVRDVQRMKGQGERSAMVTAYDDTSAQRAALAGLGGAAPAEVGAGGG